jgi:hypothetical protein
VSGRWGGVAFGLALLAVSGCGPPTRALIGVSTVAGEPTVALYVCDNQPHLTVRVYYGPNDADNYSLKGSARKHETVHVPLVHETAGWTLGGTRVALPPQARIEADSEDGSGNRLGSSVYFRLSSLPSAPSVEVDGRATKPSVLTAEGFSKAARATC